jgi:hypothetical protein
MDKCNLESTLLFGKREIQLGTIIVYFGDWLIKLGPLMFIFRVASIGMPGPMTSWTKWYGGVWTEERERQALEVGAEKEDKLPTSILSPFTPMDFEIPYPGTYYQTQFSNAWNIQFMGSPPPQPRWIYTKFYAEPREISANAAA